MADETIDELAERIAGVSYTSAEQKLIDIYRFALLQILEAIERALHARADRVPTQLQQLLNMVTRQYQTALVRSAQWTGTQLPEAFKAGMQIAETRLQYQGITQLRTSFREVNRGAVEASARETMNDLLRATTLTEESVKARVRRVMLDETRMMAATGMRPQEQAKVIAEKMAEDGVFGITARNGRHIPMDEYARIVGHTKLRQVHTEGTINLVTENGLDLVQITTHLHKPDACSPLEGKVYSLTGKTPGWPVLPKRTPFHIGCKHVTTPFVPTFRSKEELARLQEESNRPEQITVYSQERLDKLEADRKKRDRFLRQKRKLRAEDEAAVLAGTKDAPKDMKAYERSLTARANARVRASSSRAANRSNVGTRQFQPDDLSGASVSPVTTEHVKTVQDRYSDHPWVKGLNLEASDFEVVAKYAGQHGLDVDSFQEMLKGGDYGASIFLHEYAEAKKYSEKRISLFDDDAREADYPEFHGRALIVEHEHLRQLAAEKGVNVELGSLIYWNPMAKSPRQREGDLAKVAAIDGYTFVDYNERDEQAVKAFYDEIRGIKTK